MKLRKKINLYTAFLFALLLILMNITVYYSFTKLIYESELNTANKELVNITENISKSLGTIPDDALLRAHVPINGMIRIVTADNKGLPPVTSVSEPHLSKQEASFYSQEVTKLIKFQNRLYTFGSMPIILQDGRVANLQVTKSMQTASDNLSTLRLVLVMVTLLALIPVLISSRILSNLITLPVISMINTMTEIRQSGRFKRLKLQRKSKDELYQMGETFNHMIDLLEINYDKQQQFVSNASHELKTPLTIIESYASLLKRRGMEEPKIFEESIEAIHSEAIRMKEMTEQLLLLARNQEHWNIEENHVLLFDLLKQTVNAFQGAYHREIEFIEENDAPITVRTDEKKLKQLMFIFLDNARKYSENTITVVTGIEQNEVFIKIIDRGIGIEKEEIPMVFDRFYRVDKARTRKSGGSGLGLAIAKEMADAIGVRVALESTIGIGTTATLYFKK
jgi:two-component system, OmpR family, sensor histidine kinase ArlS